ncbi:MAG: sodium:calcium antiporter, partial [Bdellovibrio sp.]
LRGQSHLAAANVVGSNIINTLGVIGIAATATPLTVDPQMVQFDILYLLVITFLIGGLFLIRKSVFFHRFLGLFFIFVYGVYLFKLF